MIIDFGQMEETVIKNFYGGQSDTTSRMFADEKNRIMHGKLEPGASIGIHKHETGSEIVYILKGTGKAVFNDTQEELRPGMCHYCPKGCSHGLVNDGSESLIFFAVVPQQ